MSELLKVFQPYIGKKVALYGLGAATEKVLPDFLKSFYICGLLDSFTESGMLYGVPIISLDQAISIQVELIVVVARPGSCKAIAKRIKNQCEAYGIALFDIRGKNLISTGRSVYDFSHVPGGTKQELVDKIQRAEAVSFDLFDTLITRKVLFPTDIFDLVDAALKERGIQIQNFSQKRHQSELTLLKTGAPTLEKIYEHVRSSCDTVPDISAAELAQLEWDVDLETVVPRKAVCEIFNDLLRAGKTVSIISDTFYHTVQLKTLLKKCGIDSSCAIFASCEHGVGKTQGLFEIYRKEISAAAYLHIGDNEAADVDAASMAGLDIFRLYNGVDLLNEIGEFGLGDHMDSLSDRVKIGMFVSKIFNDPFQFETDSKKITVAEPEDIGYLFCAPLMSDFMLWFHKQVETHNLTNIWFPARDGYLLQKMYRELVPERETVYFMTSRTAAIRAGMQNAEDITYVDSMKFSGTLQDNLSVRFGIRPEVPNAPEKSGLFQYQEAILAKSEEYRANYLKYIRGLNIKEGPIAFFDFVARGTTQLYVERLVPNHMKGLYFLQIEPEFMPNGNLDVEPFYSQEEVNTSAIFADYYILEIIVTAPHPTVTHIDVQGVPVYSTETREKSELECIDRIQQGILDYFCEVLCLLSPNCRTQNKCLDELLLQLLYKVQIGCETFTSLINDDPFFNRKTCVKDLLQP